MLQKANRVIIPSHALDDKNLAMRILRSVTIEGSGLTRLVGASLLFDLDSNCNSMQT